MARHSKALLPTWEEALDTAGQRASSPLQQQLAVVAASNTATDARFKAYVGLLLGLINVSVQVRGADCWGVGVHARLKGRARSGLMCLLPRTRGVTWWLLHPVACLATPFTRHLLVSQVTCLPPSQDTCSSDPPPCDRAMWTVCSAVRLRWTR